MQRSRNLITSSFAFNDFTDRVTDHLLYRSVPMKTYGLPVTSLVHSLQEKNQFVFRVQVRSIMVVRFLGNRYFKFSSMHCMNYTCFQYLFSSRTIGINCSEPAFFSSWNVRSVAVPSLVFSVLRRRKFCRLQTLHRSFR